MSEDLEKTHRKLGKAHAKLVEERRATIKAIAEGKGIDTHVEMLLKLQSGIEVLDSLMADEDEEEGEDEDEDKNKDKDKDKDKDKNKEWSKLR
jgi:hypothetical protein